MDPALVLVMWFTLVIIVLVIVGLLAAARQHLRRGRTVRYLRDGYEAQCNGHPASLAAIEHDCVASGKTSRVRRGC